MIVLNAVASLFWNIKTKNFVPIVNKIYFYNLLKRKGLIMKFDDDIMAAWMDDEMARDAEIIKAFESWENLDKWIDTELDLLDVPEDCDNF